MAINIHWNNIEKTIMVWEFVAPWTWVEFYDAVAQQKKLFSAEQNVVDFVVDFSRAHPLPDQILVHAFYAAYQLNANVDNVRHDTYIVLIQPGSFLSSLGTVIINRFPQFAHGIRIASGMEDALGLVKSLRSETEPQIVPVQWAMAGASTASPVDSISV